MDKSEFCKKCFDILGRHHEAFEVILDMFKHKEIPQKEDFNEVLIPFQEFKNLWNENIETIDDEYKFKENK